MSLRTICDRCGAIIELHTGAAKLELQAPGVERYDLCHKCLKEFRRFMDNPSVSADAEPAPYGAPGATRHTDTGRPGVRPLR